MMKTLTSTASSDKYLGEISYYTKGQFTKNFTELNKN